MSTQAIDAHLYEPFRYTLKLSDADRIDFMSQPRWLGYKRANDILNEMNALLRMPKSTRMRSMLVVGDSNNGKTRIIDRFNELYGEGYVDEDADSIRPVVTIESPPTPDEKGLYFAILEQFWSPFKKSGSPSELRLDAISRLRACKAKLLIIDEMHSLLVGPTLKQRTVMNAIKTLGNTLRISIVGFGTRDAVRVLLTDPQHSSRFDVHSLPLWDLSPEFQKLLAGFEGILPLKKPSDLSLPAMATQLHSICEGNLGDLQRLLVACASEAIKSGEERITREIIAAHEWFKPTRGIREVAR